VRPPEVRGRRWKNLTRGPAVRRRRRPPAVFAVSVLALLVAGAAARATTDDEAVALCRTDLVDTQGGQGIRNVEVLRHDGVPFVFGDIDFPDAPGLHFRCWVYHDAVRAIDYLVNDSNSASGQSWTGDRPHGAVTPSVEPDAAAKAPPPDGEFAPHFEKPPTTSD
jgi:hypothetical protein